MGEVWVSLGYADKLSVAERSAQRDRDRLEEQLSDAAKLAEDALSKAELVGCVGGLGLSGKFIRARVFYNLF